MFHAKLRRTLAALTLVSACLLLPVQAAGLAHRAGAGREGRAAIERSERGGFSLLDLLAGFLRLAGIETVADGEKGSSRADPLGMPRANSASAEPNGDS
jgi:hypothetical protein